jgi:hypothetical protein
MQALEFQPELAYRRTPIFERPKMVRVPYWRPLAQNERNMANSTGTAECACPALQDGAPHHAPIPLKPWSVNSTVVFAAL